MSTTVAITDVTDATQMRCVYSWRRSTRANDEVLAKTVTIVNNEITLELAPDEADFSFENGYLDIFKIETATGRRIWYSTYGVDVIETTQGPDYTTGNYPLGCTYEGQAAVATMNGEHYISSTKIQVKMTQVGTAPNEGTAPWAIVYYDSSLSALTKFTVGCQSAPLGQGVIFEIYKDDAATSTTITLAAGDTSNTAVINVAI